MDEGGHLRGVRLQAVLEQMWPRSRVRPLRAPLITTASTLANSLRSCSWSSPGVRRCALALVRLVARGSHNRKMKTRWRELDWVGSLVEYRFRQQHAGCRSVYGRGESSVECRASHLLQGWKPSNGKLHWQHE